MTTRRTAAVLVIGNELLTGKIRDENGGFFARELFSLGVSLERMVFCRDLVTIIADEVRALAKAHDFVLTTGGVGPTHDDVTMEALARAFDRPIEESPYVADMLRGYYGERLQPGHLRMARVPRGTELVTSDRAAWPIFVVENVHVFPGVPELVRLKFDAIRERLRGDAPLVSRALYVSLDEGEIAEALAQVAMAHPRVAIGSYPRFRDAHVKVMITFDATDEAEIDRAMAVLVEELGEEAFVDGPGGV